jgi:hypothetical protein
MKIYGPSDSSHFGDIWTFVSGAIIQSIVNKETVYLSKYSTGEKINFEKLIVECLDHLDRDAAKIEIVEELDNQAKNNYPHQPWAEKSYIPYWVGACNNPPVKTKVKYKNYNNNSIAIQLSSYDFDKNKNIYTNMRGNFYQKYRYISCWELEKIYLNFISSNNLIIHSVGEHIGLEESIKKISESKFFLGIDSGMSHVASSVGAPVYLHFWEDETDKKFNVHNTHKNKGINIFSSFDEIYRILEFYGLKF